MSNNIGSLDATSGGQNASKALPFFGVEYDGQKAVIRRNPKYEETVESIKKMYSALRDIPSSEIRLCAKVEELDDAFWIAEEVWPDLLPGLVSVKIILDPQASKPVVSSDDRTTKEVQVSIRMDATTPTMGTMTMSVSPDWTVSQLRVKIREKLGYALDRQQLRQTLRDDLTPLANYGIQAGSTIDLSLAPLSGETRRSIFD